MGLSISYEQLNPDTFRAAGSRPYGDVFGRYVFARGFFSRQSVPPLIRRLRAAPSPEGKVKELPLWGSWQGEALTDEGGRDLWDKKTRANSYTLTGKPLAFSCWRRLFWLPSEGYVHPWLPWKGSWPGDSRV